MFGQKSLAVWLETGCVVQWIVFRLSRPCFAFWQLLLFNVFFFFFSFFIAFATRPANLQLCVFSSIPDKNAFFFPFKVWLLI